MHLQPVHVSVLLCALTSTAYALPQTDPSAPVGTSDPASSSTSTMSTIPTGSEPAGGGGGGESTGGGAKPSGLAVALGFGSRLAFVAPDDSGPTGVPGGLFGQIMVGYRLNRLLVGLGFSIGHIGSSATYVAGAKKSTVSRGDTGFLFSPTVQFDILRSRDGRVELFGGLQFGVGTTVTRRSNDPEVPDAYLPDPDARNFQLSYQVGPGLRWWARSQFALSLSAGFSGDHIFEAVNSPSGRRSEQYDFVGMYGTIGALGVF